MKIAYLAAGAAGMYCGSCLHDNTLAAALLRMGHEALLIPTYTPIRTDEENVSKLPIFYGGINVYLEQKLPLFRYAPRFVHSLLDSGLLMRWLGNRRAAVDPHKLGDLTVSVLQGEDGRQAVELQRLVRWLETDVKPDIVHLSNAMLIGMAGEIRRRLKVPVVCGLSGEDIFLEELLEPHYTNARKLLRERAGEADAFVSLNRYYADYMIQYMDLDPGRVHVVPHGLKLDGHGMRRREEEDVFTIGYFARICPEKGLHILLEALELLSQDEEVPKVRVRAAGYLGDGDKRYLARLQSRLAKRGLADRFEYLGEPDRAEKIRILQSFDVFSVPTIYRESKGLSILEAMANGVPVVQPAHGSFPELIKATDGGVLFEPENPQALAEAIKPFLVDPQLVDQYGNRAHQAVRERYNDDVMARNTLTLYEALCQGDPMKKSDGKQAQPSDKQDEQVQEV